MSNFLEGKAINMSTTDHFNNDENSLKEFSKNFYRKIIGTSNFDTFENTTLIQSIKNTHENTKTILELMKNHKESKIWFSSIIGFFYQNGIGCDIDKSEALKFYSLAVMNNEESLNQKFINLNLSEEDDNEFN